YDAARYQPRKISDDEERTQGASFHHATSTQDFVRVSVSGSCHERSGTTTETSGARSSEGREEAGARRKNGSNKAQRADRRTGDQVHGDGRNDAAEAGGRNAESERVLRGVHARRRE